jgi:hypothetical protein
MKCDALAELDHLKVRKPPGPTSVVSTATGEKYGQGSC